MDLSGIEEAVALAKQRWPGVELKVKKNKTEAHGPCPICKRAETDGFIIFESGRYFCRPGGCSGWIDENNPRTLTQAEKNAIEIDRLKRKQLEMEKRLSALERMHRCTDHITYHKLMDQDDRNYWHSQGIFDDTINRYMLGICYNCPTDKDRRASWTIPVINGGKLVNIRHRLIEAPNGDKYRPHMAGLGATLFNADNLYTGKTQVIVVEGEKKSIVLDQYGFNTVGTMGIASFPAPWAVRFKSFGTVYVALDPGAEEAAHKLAGLFDGRGKVVSLPVKPDDFFVLGGKPQVFREFMRLARKVD